ncbi:HEPN domain-containing protein [Flavobacterium sp. LM5]|uniref:HEPN domain-containing protein n=1 Tax=Flavobacterium sp. LM5 TaxID=1938610 RepID=UPI0016713517|nr:HEPN domain-containing protein [Flavobacterium sp. LM5]
MNKTQKKNRLHGQSLAIQWVGKALQNVIVDVQAGGSIAHQLMGNDKSMDGGNGLETLALGCDYVMNFVLPFSLELALKSLLIKDGKEPRHTHDLFKLYDELSDEMKAKLQKEYFNHLRIAGFNETESLNELLLKHRKSFELGRYLENPEKMKNDEEKLQLAIYTVLGIIDLRNSDSLD